MNNSQETILNLRWNMTSQFRVGSSETICKETSLFKKDKNFLTWLIGFTEGDGSFVVPSKGLPQFEITQNLKDIDVLYKIKSNLF